MKKDDARYSTLEQLHERRKQVVRLHRKGYKVMQIVDLCGLSYPSVRAAIDRYKVGGLAAIKPAVRGKRAGQGRALNAEQEHALRKLICDKRPEQLKMEFALWSRAAVMQLIEQEYGIKLTVRGVGKYLGNVCTTRPNSKPHLNQLYKPDQMQKLIELALKSRFQCAFWRIFRPFLAI